MKGMGRYTIFHYFSAILCQTIGDQVMWPHKNPTEHAHNRKCPLSMPSVPNSCIASSKLYKHPTPGASFHRVTRFTTKNIQTPCCWKLSDRIFLFNFNYFIIELLFNYTKCLNIVRTSSKTSYCTLQGQDNIITFTDTFTDCRLLETHCPDFVYYRMLLFTELVAQ